MSFWDKVKEIIKNISSTAQQQNKEMKKFEYQYKDISEGEWQQKIQKAESLAEKTAIFNVAKRKGWVKDKNS